MSKSSSIIQPTHQGYPVGNSPGSSAVGVGNATNASQASLSKAMHGGTNTVGIVPGSSPAAVNTQSQNASLQLSQQENSKYDNAIGGRGSKKHKKGGMKWGCYSGGKKTKRTNRKRKSKKNKKSRKCRK